MNTDNAKVIQLTHHSPDLKEAIYYLPRNIDPSLICKALKQVYEEEGKKLAIEWFYKAKIKEPDDFDRFWDQLKFTSYELEYVDKYFKENIYDLAEEAGWRPKALRKGKNTKRPPQKKAMKIVGEKLNEPVELQTKLTQARERDLPEKEKSFLAPAIVNVEGACYSRPFIRKEDIPEDTADLLTMMDKIVDCEVKVLAALEYLLEKQGRDEQDIEVRYRIELNDRKGKRVVTEVTHEEISTRTRFSNLLISKGFLDFLGSIEAYRRFLKFLIKDQQYPTVQNVPSWGEISPGNFLFSNGLFDVRKGTFLKADDKDRIDIGNKLLVCPRGSVQIKPPLFSVPKEDSEQFLIEKFKLWEYFNGSLNVRSTIGYAVAVIFSRELMKRMGAFPILFKFGVQGTGKSTDTEWFMALFGYLTGNRQAFTKQSTLKGVSRLLTLPLSFPFFLDDYRNHETNSQVPDLTNSILGWYHRSVTSMAKKSTDHKTVETPMNACIVMTGNDKPTDPAVLDRLVILNYQKHLKAKELQRLNEISDHVHRFSEFIGLLFQQYDGIREKFFYFFESNRSFLQEEGFQGRTSNNWAVVLAGYQCVEYILPGLQPWFEDFEGFRSEICYHIKKEKSLQTQHNPLHDFFEVLEYYATQKVDSASEYNNKYYVIDHRHFRIREEVEVTKDQSFPGPVLAIHLRGIWNTLQDQKAPITREQHLTTLDSFLQNSCYFISKSMQTLLTKSIGSRKESNRRCYYLNVDELSKKGMLSELIEKAREYESRRGERLSS